MGHFWTFGVQDTFLLQRFQWTILAERFVRDLDEDFELRGTYLQEKPPTLGGM